MIQFFSVLFSRRTAKIKLPTRPLGRRSRLLIENLEDRCLLDAGGLFGFEELQLDSSNYAPDRVLVQFEADTVPQTYVGTVESLGLGIHAVNLDEGVAVEAALAQLNADPNVVFAEPDYRVFAEVVPNDPDYNQLYGLDLIQAPQAWDLQSTPGDASSIVVAVIDTGIDYTHPDIAANMWRNTGEIPNNGIDDDGNGYTDDYYGYDFYDGDGDPFDTEGHGTHVAGTIGAVGNNDDGVSGVAWDVQLMAVRFLGRFGGSLSGAISSIDYAVANGAQILNNSWGGGGFSSSLQAAIQRAEANDVLFVAAAGNDNRNNDARPAYPASYNVPNVISVAATNNNDVLAGFSNYGANSVDIAAPGVGIESTIPNNTYSSYSGTSMAAPHVSGAAAVLWAENPDLSYSEVRDLLLNNTDPLPPQTKQVATGRLNLFKALEASQPQEPNPTPPGLTLTETNDSTAVSEDGVSDTYTFVLESQPSSNVTIQIQTDGQVTTSVSEVTFTPSNWSSVQQVRVFAVDDSAFEGNHTSVISHTVSSEDSNYNGFEVANVDVAISDNDTPPPPPPPSNDTLYFTLENSTTAASLSVGTEDIVAFDGTNYSIVFDGSDVGLGDLAIDAFDVISENQVLLSFSTPAFNGAIDDSDIILFEGTLGENTSGTFYYYFDGSDVGLTSRSEDVDGLTLLDDGRLLISTVGNGSVVGGSFADEDILIFTPTSLGMNTGGSFLMLLDSSSVGLANGSEDIDGFTFKDGDLYFTTVGNFAVSGLSGADDDVGIMDFSSGSFNSQLYLNFTSNDLKGLDFAGTATASSLGLLGGRSIEDVPFGRAELNIIDQATSTSTGLTSGDLASVLSATSSDDFMLQSRTQDVNTNNVPVAQSATIVTPQAQSEQVGGLGSLIVLDTTDDQESEQERESDEIQLDHSTKQVSVPIKTAEVTPVDPGIVEVEEIEVVVTGSETSADLDVQAETEAPKVEEETVSCTSQVTITGMVSVGVILSAGWNWKPSRSPERRKRSLPESV